eukprot:6193400-Pleurochrysis_carterae.AAC.1
MVLRLLLLQVPAAPVAPPEEPPEDNSAGGARTANDAGLSQAEHRGIRECKEAKQGCSDLLPKESASIISNKSCMKNIEESSLKKFRLCQLRLGMLKASVYLKESAGGTIPESQTAFFGNEQGKAATKSGASRVQLKSRNRRRKFRNFTDQKSLGEGTIFEKHATRQANERECERSKGELLYLKNVNEATADSIQHWAEGRCAGGGAEG